MAQSRRGLRVLLAEDSDSDALLVTRELRRSFGTLELERVETPEMFSAALERGGWDLIISDHQMPRFSSTEALRILRESKADIPFIIVSGTIGEDFAVTSMRNGASDYILKGNLARLIPAIERELRDAEMRRSHERTEHALRQSQAKNQKFIEANIIGVMTWHAGGAILDANDAFLATIGRTREELAEGTVRWPELTPPEYHSLDVQALVQLAAHGRCAPYEKELIRKDGSRVPVLVATAQLENSSNQGIAFILDISDRKRAEEVIRVREARFRALIEKSSEAVSLISTAGKILYLTPPVTRILGYRPFELVGHDSFELVHPEDRPAFVKMLSSIVNDPTNSQTIEYRAQHCDGTWRWIEATTTNMLRDDAVGALVSNFRDIDSKKRAEESLRHTEEQLRHAQKMEAIGRLAGGISHDFNNMLSVILSYSTIALSEIPQGNPLRADLEEVKKAGLRAADLTRQLLAFSRQQVLQPTVIDVNQTIVEMDKMLHRLIGEDIELVLAAEASPGLAVLDRGQLEQVIMNLVVNARDAMPDGGKLTITTENALLSEAFAAEHLGVKPGRHLMLSVSDTGVGMDPATQARIFEPFFTTKEVGKGTGLGLSTVFGIIQQSGGSIWVKSELGKGSTFTIYFAQAASSLKKTQTPLPGVAPARGSETILLVEDEKAVRLLTRNMLRASGYTVLEAETPGDALLISEQYKSRIHLLLSDVVMPRLNGPVLAERLRTLRPELKVLFVSGYASSDTVRKALESGTPFLQKPITPDALLRKIREVLGEEE